MISEQTKIAKWISPRLPENIDSGILREVALRLYSTLSDLPIDLPSEGVDRRYLKNTISWLAQERHLQADLEVDVWIDEFLRNESQTDLDIARTLLQAAPNHQT